MNRKLTRDRKTRNRNLTRNRKLTGDRNKTKTRRNRNLAGNRNTRDRKDTTKPWRSRSSERSLLWQKFAVNYNMHKSQQIFHFLWLVLVLVIHWGGALWCCHWLYANLTWCGFGATIRYFHYTIPGDINVHKRYGRKTNKYYMIEHDRMTCCTSTCNMLRTSWPLTRIFLWKILW